MHLSAFVSGLGLGFSLIVVIGAQNAFVLRQGLRREHVLPVVVICAASDVALYVAGAAGFGALARAVPWLIDLVRWVGAVFLVGYGLLAIRRTLSPGATALQASPDEPAREAGHGGVAVLGRTSARTARRVVAAALAFTWLNPHVYLDTVFLAGSVAATHAEGRWSFVAGASIASIAWFTGLGYGARILGRWLGSRRSWRILDTAIAVVMITTGVSLVLPILR